MVMSKAATVKDYLDGLPEERRKVMASVRSLVRKHLPKGYEEKMGFGMICWQVPLKTFPDTYNGQPLCYAGLAAQKNGYSLYLMTAYVGEKDNPLKAAYKAAGKKLDMGKSCLRFKQVDDLVPEALGKIIAKMPPDAYIEHFEKSRKRR
jgi:hypothetical protein